MSDKTDPVEEVVPAEDEQVVPAVDERTAAQRAQQAWALREHGRPSAPPARQLSPGELRNSVAAGGDHRPFGSKVRKTADWEDDSRTWYPTRGEVDPSFSNVTPTRFHPLELPDEQAQYEANMLPQIIPAHQVSADHETHSLGEGVPVDSPQREMHRRK